MKLASLKIATNKQTTQSAAAIEDTLPPVIHAGPGQKPPRIVRHLNVDEVLARSLPKVAEDFKKAA